MLEILSSHIAGPIVKKSKRSQYYSLLIDETTDVAVMKQMVISARYLTPESEVYLNYSQNLTHSNQIKIICFNEIFFCVYVLNIFNR